MMVTSKNKKTMFLAHFPSISGSHPECQTFEHYFQRSWNTPK